jgi:hypothetical protein
MHPEVGVLLDGFVVRGIDAGFFEQSKKLFHGQIPLVAVENTQHPRNPAGRTFDKVYRSD